jgi:hypothetical protein
VARPSDGRAWVTRERDTLRGGFWGRQANGACAFPAVGLAVRSLRSTLVLALIAPTPHVRSSHLFRPTIDSASAGRARRPRPVPKAHVRPLTPDDLDQVVELHRQGFGEGAPREELRTFLGDVFFGHPWIDDSLPSLAYVGKTGALIGCLGCMPRPMMLGGEPIRAVVSHNFLVAPEQRNGLAAIQLMRALMAGKPDLTLADGNAAARKISEALGARTLSSRSNRWFRVLRPAGLGVHLVDEVLTGWKAPPVVHRALAGISAVPVTIARALSSPPTRSAPVGDGAGSEASEVVEVMDRLTRHLALRPVYTEATFAWLLEVLRRTRRDQSLRVAAVRASGEIVGWYVYYSRSGGVGRVLQLGAGPNAQEQVLEQLFADALNEGNVAVTGQSDPAWSSAFKATSCRIRPGRTWMLLQTSDPRIERAFATSDVFLSRLEGEGWLHFGY